jgi:DHA2 family multidrug resistance protein
LTAFVVIELSTARPMVDLELLRIPTFWTVNANAFLFGLGAVGIPFLLTAFLQDVLGYDPWTTSVALAPTVLATVAGMALGRPLGVRLSQYVTMALGFILMAAGCWWLAALRPESALGDVAAARALLGFGNGLMFVPMGLVTIAAIPPDRMPAATGLIAIDRQIASAFAIAIAATAFEHALFVERAHVAERLSRNLPAVAQLERAKPQRRVPSGAARLRSAAEREAQNDAYAQAFRVGAFACGAAAMFAFAPLRLPGRRRVQIENAG